MFIEMKIKVKSLAAEAKIIRTHERQTTGAQRNSLAEHRRGTVRYEARHSLLAYGYLRGVPYRAMEKSSKTPFNVSKVEHMVKKYGPAAHNEAFAAWLKVG